MSWVPLSVRHGGTAVQALWPRGIDSKSRQAVITMEAAGDIRKVRIGWWLRGIGWCPTAAVLRHALLKRGLVRAYVPTLADISALQGTINAEMAARLKPDQSYRQRFRPDS